MSNYRVVITDCEYENIENEQKILREIGAEVHLYQTRNEKEIIELSKNCDALIFQYAKITQNIINNLDNCKIIAKYATGIDGIDIDSVTNKGICFSNVNDYCTDEVSTHAMALLLNMVRKIKLLYSNARQDNWNYRSASPIYSLKDCVVGVIGLGKISSDFIRKLSAFCDEIWVYSSSGSEEKIKSLGGKKKSFEEIIRYSDFISIHSPLTDSTKNLFDKSVFKSMKTTASIINLGRGAIINEDDLIWALEEKEIAGAALDVLTREPPDKHNKLLFMDNVIITPHSGWYSVRSQAVLQKTVAEEVKRVLTGYFPINLVNKELRQKLKLKDI